LTYDTEANQETNPDPSSSDYSNIYRNYVLYRRNIKPNDWSVT